MRVTEIKTHAVSVPLKHNLWTAHEALSTSNVILTEVRTDEGLVGYGQIHAAPQKAVCDWVAKLAEVVRGMDPAANVAAWEKMFALTSPRPGGVAARDGLPPPLPRGARTQVMAAIAGIDIALWDLKGKIAGMPVYRLLGAENKPVFTYATGGYYVEGKPLDTCVAELAGFVANGYTAVKLKTGAETIAEEVQRIRAVRDAIGPGTRLMLDMNAPYDLDTAIDFAHAVEPYDIFWLEEPLHWYLQPADFLRLAASTRIPLAHAERELTRFTVRDFIASGAIRYVQFDATRAAGFTEALRIAHLAEQHGVRIAPHHAPELHGHLVAAFPRGGFCVESHGDADRDPIWFEMYSERAEVRKGLVHLNDKPGFGVEINWDYVKRHRA